MSSNVTVLLDTLKDPVIQIHIIDTDPYYLNKYLKMDFALRKN